MIHIFQQNGTVQIIHTYVPPLTHTPGLGLSMMGSQSEPPFMLLEAIQQRTSNQTRSQMGSLFQEHKKYLDDGVRLRLQMQQQTHKLIEQLPTGFVHQAWKERLDHEDRIGELHVWRKLLDSME
jgi:hypothetical protein